MIQRQPSSLGDLLRRIAFDYVRFGYYRYAVRTIPEEKNLLQIDEKIRRTYGVTSCRTTRMRQRQEGRAVIEYLRWHHTFVLLATDGKHELFSKVRSYDIRETPLHLGGYSVGLRGKTVSIEVSRKIWGSVKRGVEKIELRERIEVEKVLASLPYFNFPGVVRQKWQLLQKINQRRKAAGLGAVNIPYPKRYDRPIIKKNG
jgi:hypothetical protein